MNDAGTAAVLQQQPRRADLITVSFVQDANP